MTTAAITSNAMAEVLADNIEGRLENMQADGLEDSPDYLDSADVLELLNVLQEFPASIELSDAEARQLFIAVEAALDFSGEQEAFADLQALHAMLKAEGYDR
jgi:hypothetical protein